jgi:cytoskeletal protein CcmA (bactofilin family)
MFSLGPSTNGNGNGTFKERRRVEPATLSIVAADLVVSGDLETAGVVRVEGRVVGTVRAGQQVLVGAEAVVEGDLVTREAVVGGTVHGTIHASDRVEIQPHAVVEGDIITRNLVVQEGGRVNGAVTMRIDAAVDAPETAGY